MVLWLGLRLLKPARYYLLTEDVSERELDLKRFAHLPLLSKRRFVALLITTTA
jgi:hypothetical protein